MQSQPGATLAHGPVLDTPKARVLSNAAMSEPALLRTERLTYRLDV